MHTKTKVRFEIKLKYDYTLVDGKLSQIPAFELTKASAKFKNATSNRLGGDAFTIMYLQSLKLLRPMVKEKHYQENTIFDLDSGSRSHKMLPRTLNFIVTYAPLKFDVATSHG